MSQEKTSKKVCFCWNINYTCNYRCPYCFFYNRWEEVIKDNGNFPAEEWIENWRRIYDIYGGVRIETAGGEPFTFPAFVKCINEICKFHTFTITTNLSCSVGTLKSIIEQNNPERLKWNASFHPSFADLDDFLEKVALLNNNKFQTLVMYVAYPPQLKQIAYFKRVFQENGITSFIQAFQGKYKGIVYPEGYTDEEKRMIYALEDDACGGSLKKLIENQMLKKRTRGKLCLAGFKYAFVDSTGIVYRCSRERKHPMGNFLSQDFRLLEQPLSCEFDDCPCEFIWLVEENQEIYKPDMEMNKEIINTDSTSVKLSNESSASKNIGQKTSNSSKYPAPGRVFWCWDILFSCNYKCSYCAFSEGRQHPSGESPYLGTQELVKIWNEIYKKYGKCHIHISGGEPSIYPDFFELIAELSTMHALEFDTNLSFDPSILIKNVKREKVKINSSFHPGFVDFNTFFSKLLRLRDSGFEIGMAYVGYPPFLQRLKGYSELCTKNNVELTIQAFRGTFNGKEYPLSYTDSEKRLINISCEGATDGAATKRILKYHTEERMKKERRLCRMGQMGAKIYPNGDVFRCCYHPVNYNRVGNIFDDPDFKLFDKPRYCDIVPCPCWRAMIVGKENEWQHYWCIK